MADKITEEIAKRELDVKTKLGLHARPAAILVQMINKYRSDVLIEKDGEVVNGRSILGVMSLGAEQGSFLKFRIIGQDADLLMRKIEKLFENNFEEG